MSAVSHSLYLCLQMHDIVKAVGNCSYNQLVEKIISCKQSDNSELAGEGGCFLLTPSDRPDSPPAPLPLPSSAPCHPCVLAPRCKKVEEVIHFDANVPNQTFSATFLISILFFIDLTHRVEVSRQLSLCASGTSPTVQRNSSVQCNTESVAPSLHEMCLLDRPVKACSAQNHGPSSKKTRTHMWLLIK